MSTEVAPHSHHYRREMSYSFGVIGPEHEADLLEALCEGYTRANQIQIRAEPAAYPCCLGCGSYRYVEPENCQVYDFRRGRARKTDPNCQHVFGAFPLDRRKRGTCIDLACMLAAIFREKDGDRRARVVIEHQFRIVGADDEGVEIKERLDGKYHAMVMKGDGTIVDPTTKVKALAVGAHQKACDCGG